jgi:hypothetical protein
MVRENQDLGEPQLRETKTEGGVSLRTAALLLGAVAALTVAGAVALRWALSGSSVATGAEEHAPPTTSSTPSLAVRAFAGWDKPDFVLLLSAQEHGYLLPCGCSSPQRGGLERRYNLIQSLKQKGWPVVPLELGDVAQLHGPQSLPNVQGLIKYRYAMLARKLMGYPAAGIGEYEAALPFKAALDEWALNEQRPRILAANLHDKETNFPQEVSDFVVENVNATPYRVGVAGVVGPSVRDKMTGDPQVQFDLVRDTLRVVLGKIAAERTDFRVLLYQGSAKEAHACAKSFPEFQVILCRCEDDEGSSRPEMEGNTFIISVGHKGKNVGVVGAFHPANPGQPFTMRYQQVVLGEEYMTPAAERGAHPVVQLMERYTKELKEGSGSGPYLQKYGQGNHALQVAVQGAVPTYAGSERCKSCHKHAYQVWENSQHAHAYKTLVDKKHPSLRQYDGECIVCHVTGFGYKSGFTDEVKTPKLKDVGCESCHGPGSAHVKDQYNETWHELMNPWKAKGNETVEQKARRVLRINEACRKCHDEDNDVHWDFDKKWPQIAHPSTAK